MVNPWETEDEDSAGEDNNILHEAISKHAGDNARVSAYKVEAHLVLEDSNKTTWGYVSLIESSFSDKQGEMCGTWSRSPIDNKMHIFLAADTETLLSRAAERNDELRNPKKTLPQLTPSLSTELAADMQATIDSIRRKLKGAE